MSGVIWFRALVTAFLAAVGWCCGSGLAHGTTIDTSPRIVVLLSYSKRFVAQDGWNSVALYGAEATVIHRFPAPERVNEIAVTSDETKLLIACSDGSLSLWEVETGKQLWEQRPKQTGLKYVYDASFAHDGMSCIVCDERDQAVVLKTTTGERLAVVQFPPMQTNIMSAALSPDGRSGVLIDLGERLHTFDLATCTPKDTGLTGAWPVRYSADGKHVAFRSNNSGTSEQVRVVSMDGSLAWRDVGTFSHIGHIRPTADGAFLACGRIGGRYADNATVIGVRVRPGMEKLEELWRSPVEKGVDIGTDFSPETMIGVSTDFRLVTRIVDLRTGASLHEVDNSENYRPSVLSYTSRGGFEWLFRSWVGRGVLLIVLLGSTIVVFRFWTRRRKAG